MAWPFNEIDEIVVFTLFYERGFSMPAHDFLRGLVFFYGLELINLDPNSILQLSLYIHLCEAILGIDPLSTCGAISSMSFQTSLPLLEVQPFSCAKGASRTTSSSN